MEKLPEFKTTVIVKLQVEGIHNWPQCPFDEVAFLRHPHRHMFHIKAEKLVTHSDRDVEIIMLKRDIEGYLKSRYEHKLSYSSSQVALVFGRMSCEEIATEVAKQFELETCEVLEDNENGAKVYKTF